MKKPKQLILGIIASWFAFIAIDSTASVFFRISNRKLKEPAKTLYTMLIAIRAVLIFLLAFLNFLLFVFLPKKQLYSDIVRD